VAQAVASQLHNERSDHQCQSVAADATGRYHPCLRTQEHAQASADSLFLRRQRETKRAEVEILGRADLELGDAIELQDLPAGGDGTYVVLALRHSLSPRGGFMTYASLGGVP